MSDSRTETAPREGRVPERRRSARSWASFAVGIGLLVLALLAALWWFSPRNGATRFTSAAVTRGSVIRAIPATGTLNPILTVIVGAGVSGIIQEVSCDYNSVVTIGQVCAEIDPRPYRAAVEQDRAALDVARAQLAMDRAALAYAKAADARSQRLRRQDSISADAADKAKSAYEQALAQITLDQATIEQRQANLAAAQVNLDYTKIVSPVNGVVVSRDVTVGQTVAASFQTPTMFLIATDLTKMQVDTNVSEGDIGAIKEGDRASFTVLAFPERTFHGVVTQVRQSPQMVQNVVTYDVVVSVDNQELALKPGMTAAVKIVIARRDDVLRVPDQALRYAPQGATPEATRVWVLKGGKPVPVPIVIGLDDGTYAEVIKGDLRPGDAVIVGEQRAATKRVPTPAFRF